MYKRLVILTCIIFIVLAGTAWLGYHAIRLHAEGLEGRRIGQFAAAGENIRREVLRRIDEFINTEQKRPYTDYQYYYIPEDKNLRQVALVRSPLAGKLEHELACGYFQIDALSQITTPYYQGRLPYRDYRSDPVSVFVNNLREHLLPALNENFGVNLSQEGVSQQALFENVSNLLISNAQRAGSERLANSKLAPDTDGFRNSQSRRGMYEINIIKAPQDAQVYTQQRTNVVANEAYNLNQTLPQEPQIAKKESKNENAAPVQARPNTPVVTYYDQPNPSLATLDQPGDNYWQELSDLQDRLEELLDSRLHFILTDRHRMQPQQMTSAVQQGEFGPRIQARTNDHPAPLPAKDTSQTGNDNTQDELVLIRQEPFVPLVVSTEDQPGSLFNGQVYLLRHVQVGSDHYLQGFRLNENRLLQIVQQAAAQFTSAGPMPMKYQISRTDTHDADYTAILDFGFGTLMLNLIEKDPLWIARQVDRLKLWYFAVIALMSMVVVLGLTSLWRGVHAQVVLARKKDDFISAVSHELRTPLTSLRMYAEMLEKNWVPSDEKRHEYYGSMRQESERLSRLIENVLDFSRIQRHNKKYQFKLGDINTCVGSTVETMRAYAERSGFELKADYGILPSIRFDHDAVVQIVINLIDNAIKYARNAVDKSIYVRTSMRNGYIAIEIEDRGPGVPHHQRKKIFDEFYRCEDESTRQTTGTGLGLALVQRFAQAHNGFVELLSAKPNGALFRVALASDGG